MEPAQVPVSRVTGQGELRVGSCPVPTRGQWEYSLLQVTAVSTNYHIEVSGKQFAVIDEAGEQVGVYSTEAAAQQDIERCKSEDLLYDTAQQLVDLAVKTLMKMHSIDRQTALYWIRSATETTD
jgi:hypothetical protein